MPEDTQDPVAREWLDSVVNPVLVQQAKAQRWHDRRQHGSESCWCCCRACDPDENGEEGNPHWFVPSGP